MPEKVISNHLAKLFLAFEDENINYLIDPKKDNDEKVHFAFAAGFKQRWRPITDFEISALSALGMVLIKRIVDNYESYPRVSRFVQHSNWRDEPNPSDDHQCGYWEDQVSKAIAFQSHNLKLGWATHIMIIDRPSPEYEEVPRVFGYVNKEAL